MSKRKNEISIINVLFCLIVVLIHLISKPISSLSMETALYKPYTALWRASSFVVQGFIFLSGVKTFLGNRREGYIKFISKRIKTIIIPYVVAEFIYYMYFVYIVKYFPFSIKEFSGYLVRGDIAAQFYFVVIIVQFYLLYPLWCRILDKVKPFYAIVGALVINAVFGMYLLFIVNALTGFDAFHSYDKFFTTYIMYWVGGMYVGKYYDKFIGFIKKCGIWICVLAFVAGLADAALFLLMRYGYVRPLHLETVHSLYCSLMIMAVYFIAYKVKDKPNIIISSLDKASYYIYLVHVLFIFVLDNVMEYFGLVIASTTLSFVLRSIIIYVCCIVFSLMYSYVIKVSTVKQPLSR